ncbi:hypothetical protein D3C80_1360760 [compost metagenome]
MVVNTFLLDTVLTSLFVGLALERNGRTDVKVDHQVRPEAFQGHLFHCEVVCFWYVTCVELHGVRGIDEAIHQDDVTQLQIRDDEVVDVLVSQRHQGEQFRQRVVSLLTLFKQDLSQLYTDFSATGFVRVHNPVGDVLLDPAFNSTQHRRLTAKVDAFEGNEERLNLFLRHDRFPETG